MKQKNIVITGASDGIGAAAAAQLKLDGHNLFLVGRSPEKTATVAGKLGVPFAVADFAHLDQVRALADEILDRCPVIDVLANNAGLMAPSQPTFTDDGFEFTWQVNYLAMFLLNHLLLDRLTESHATVIATSSMAHWMGRLQLEARKESYTSWDAYGTSKLAAILHTRELARRHGDGVNAVCFHPGVVKTNFSNGSGSFISSVYGSRFRIFIPASKGADTLVFLAEGTPGVDFQAGDYLVKRRPAATQACSRDIRLADALWNHTELDLGLM